MLGSRDGGYNRSLRNPLKRKMNKKSRGSLQRLWRRLTVAICLGMPVAMNAQHGSTAYNFLDIPSSTHAYALGGSGIAVIDDDVSLASQNPALIGPELDRQLAFGYMHYMGSGNFAGVHFGTYAGERGAWAIGVRYLNYGSIDRYDANGTADGGSFSPQDLVVEGTYSHDFTDRLRGGINLKFAYSNYDARTALALCADLGLNYYDDEHDLSLSLVVRNAGGQIKRFDKAYDRLPFDVQLGYMQGLGTTPFSLAITATHLTKWNLPYYSHPKEGETGDLVEKSNFGSNLFRHLIFGLQYQSSENFYIALAYNYKARTDMSAYSRNFLSGFSLGLGLKVRSFSVGAAYAMPHKQAATFMINLGCTLGELLN